jgi:bifunctional non-homologous end joining protein LigD
LKYRRGVGVPDWVEPMKAVLTEERFSDPDWVFERKLDGLRCLAFKDNGRVRMLSRNKLSFNERFPRIAEALDGDPATDFVVDGEIVAFARGRSTFETLQQRGGRPAQIYLYLFDVLYAAGEDVTKLPWRERKALLRSTLAFDGPIRLTQHRNRDGEELFRQACEKGWEGLIAKRADAPYAHGRSRDWLKFKCGFEQELVVGGFTAPRGSRTDLGALLVGYYEGGRLRYAGKVGTGFTQATLRELAAKLDGLRRDDSPFADPVKERNVTWVQPRVVGQVGFGEWTRDGRLRHPRFLGLREDKAPEEVVRE